jgi:ATP phosphoribosyltransferase regulatory subunit
VLRAAPQPSPGRTLYLPYGTLPETARTWRAQSYATIAALDPAADPAEEARRLRCTHMLSGGTATSLG